jgi:PPOX class probable F420-dependent enzyme
MSATALGAGPFPASHADLLDRPLPAVLTTEMPDGRLQSTVVWFDRQDGHLLVNTMREFQKARNLTGRPRATLLVVEPGTGRWVEVRARAQVADRDALAHLDELALRYTGAAPYFGRVVAASLAAAEHPIVFRLVPSAVATGPRYFHGGTRAAAPPTAVAPQECRAEPPIPVTHTDLLRRPIVVALSTRMPDGSAQTQPVWCSLDGNDVLVNTTRQRRKARNLARDPRATVLAVDPDDSSRWIEIRGDVSLSGDGAQDHLDRLTQAYTAHEHYYGGIYPHEQREREDRVIVRIHPRRITCDAVHR